MILDFVIQGRCPNIIGTGGRGYTIPCELTGNNQYHDRNVLSLAAAVRNIGGSQFFICHNRQKTKHLDKNHTCFGKAIENVDVIDDIRPSDKIIRITIVEN